MCGCEYQTHLVVDTGLLDHGNEDVIGLLDDLNALRRDVADDSDRNTWARERVAHDQFLWDTQLAAKAPNFILEELPQGLDQLETLL